MRMVSCESLWWNCETYALENRFACPMGISASWEASLRSCCDNFSVIELLSYVNICSSSLRLIEQSKKYLHMTVVNFFGSVSTPDMRIWSFAWMLNCFWERKINLWPTNCVRLPESARAHSLLIIANRQLISTYQPSNISPISAHKLHLIDVTATHCFRN